LFGLNRCHDVAQLSGTTAFDRRQQCAVTAQAGSGLCHRSFAIGNKTIIMTDT
jgi:hypothetical protein